MNGIALDKNGSRQVSRLTPYLQCIVKEHQPVFDVVSEKAIAFYMT